MSAATVTVSDSDSKLSLAGYNARLSTYDAYELQVSHRREVVGEFYRNRELEEQNEYLQNVRGVYRIKISTTGAHYSHTNITA